jgi:nucleoside-diphosphate-sugar epimerase
MRVLVVGASGFVGARVLDLLVAAGHEVTNLDVRPSARYPDLSVVGDVRDRTAVEPAIAGQDAVIVLAAQHLADGDPLSLYESVNVGGAQILTEAAAAAGVTHVVLVSSAAVYGPGRTLSQETTPPEPADEFARTKLAAERVFAGWAAGDAGRSLTVVRPATVFGEGDRRTAPDTFPGLVAPILHRAFVPAGHGLNRRSLAYVGNLAAFVASRLDAAAGTVVVNFADKPDLRAADLVAAVRGGAGLRTHRVRIPVRIALLLAWFADLSARLTRRRPVLVVDWVRAFTAESTVATDRLEDLGYKPAVPLDEALERTLGGDTA